MKDILARIYFLYGAILFLITMLPVAFMFWIIRNTYTENSANKLVQKCFQIWMGVYMPLIFCPVTHKGRANFKKGQNYVVTLNHNSMADIPVSSPGIPTANKTLAKIEISRIPIFGYIYKTGSILLDRNDTKSRQSSYAKMLTVLEKGLHLCLFPEGTRNKTNEPLSRFHDGAFKVAMIAQKPIMPGLIFGTKNIFHPTKKMWAWPHKLEFHFLEPIDTISYTNADDLKLKVFEVMKTYYVANK
jgi:1-acyl-sn-glycerol-3-phosphate acyltransferase